MKYRVTQYAADGEVVNIRTSLDEHISFITFGLAIPGVIDERATKIVIEEVVE